MPFSLIPYRLLIRVDLLGLLQDKDLLVLKAGMELKKKATLYAEELNRYSELLLGWASEWICEV